jgi:hypothetical protein
MTARTKALALAARLPKSSRIISPLLSAATIQPAPLAANLPV